MMVGEAPTTLAHVKHGVYTKPMDQGGFNPNPTLILGRRNTQRETPQPALALALTLEVRQP